MIPAEKTLIILKHDCLLRGLVGKAFERFEKVGLKMLACKMVHATREQAEKHYGWGEEWQTNMGKKTLATYRDFGVDPKDVLGTDNPAKLGHDVYEKLVEYLIEGPILVTVWEGVSAIAIARKVRGTTTPISADVGSFAGDFSHDSQFSAPLKGRALKNLAHCSGDAEEAEVEIKLWFGDDFKPQEYDRVDSVFF